MLIETTSVVIAFFIVAIFCATEEFFFVALLADRLLAVVAESDFRATDDFADVLPAVLETAFFLAMTVTLLT